MMKMKRLLQFVALSVGLIILALCFYGGIITMIYWAAKSLFHL